MATVAKKKTIKKKVAKKTATKSAARSMTPLDKMESFIVAKMKSISVKDMKVNLDVDSLQRSLPHLPTGSLIIDHLIGGTPNKYGVKPCPGVPRGKLTQVYGQNSCGKTTFALTLSAITCVQGGVVLYIDLENEIDPTYAAHLGVPIGDDSKFKIYAPDTLEQVISIIMIAARMGVDLIIIDSVGAGVTKETYEMSAEDVAKGETGRLGQVAAAWAKGLQKIKPIVAKHGTAVVGISQLRSGGPGAKEPVIQGGKAWEFFTSVRLKLSRIGWDKASEYNAVTHKVESDVKVGSVIRAELQKCKVSRNQALKQDFYIKHGEGIDDHHSVFDIAVKYKVIVKSGSHFTWGERKFHGTNNALNFLRENDDEFFSLYNLVVPYLSDAQLSSGQEEEFDDDDIDEEALEKLLDGSDVSDVVEIAEKVEAGNLAETEAGDSSEAVDSTEDEDMTSLEADLDEMLPG